MPRSLGNWLHQGLTESFMMRTSGPRPVSLGLLGSINAKSTNSFAQIYFLTFSGTWLESSIATDINVFSLWYPVVSCGPTTLSITLSTVCWTVLISRISSRFSTLECFSSKALQDLEQTVPEGSR